MVRRPLTFSVSLPGTLLINLFLSIFTVRVSGIGAVGGNGEADCASVRHVLSASAYAVCPVFSSTSVHVCV